MFTFQRPRSARVSPAWAIPLLLVATAGCADEAVAPLTAGAAVEPVEVAVTPVQARDQAVTIEATGSFVADERSDVAPEASGRVLETLVDVGDTVKPGQPLIRIQGIDAGLRLDEARAAVARAEATVRRTEAQNTLATTTADRFASLLNTGDVSKTLADQSRTQAETTRQELATARASLAEKAVSDVVVSAPFAGTISQRMVSPGEYVQPSTPVVTLVKTNPLRLQLAIPGVQAARVEVGQSVTTSVDAYPGAAFSGVVTAVNPVITPESRSFIAEVRVPNPDLRLRPGMFAVATIDQGETTRALFVPREALIEDVNTNSWRVFVITADERAALRVVQLAPRQPGGPIQLLAGVAEGERVAVTRLGDLYDGAPVTIAPPTS